MIKKGRKKSKTPNIIDLKQNYLTVLQSDW